MIGEGDCGAIGGMGDWQWNPKYPEKTFVHHNPIWPDQASNPGRRGGKPATNRLSYGAATPECH
jgi:hypothetical protein